MNHILPEPTREQMTLKLTNREIKAILTIRAEQHLDYMQAKLDEPKHDSRKLHKAISDIKYFWDYSIRHTERNKQKAYYEILKSRKAELQG